MDQITSLNFLGDPHQLTQTIRGEIFIMIDMILYFSFPNEANEHLKTFIEFLERFIKFFVDYLSNLPFLIKDVSNKLFINSLKLKKSIKNNNFFK